METFKDWLTGGGIYVPRAECLGNDDVLIATYLMLNMLTIIAFGVTSIVLLRYRSGEFLADLMRVVIGLFLATQAIRGISQSLTLYLTFYRIDVAVHAATTGMAVVAAGVALYVNAVRGSGRRG